MARELGLIADPRLRRERCVALAATAWSAARDATAGSGAYRFAAGGYQLAVLTRPAARSRGGHRALVFLLEARLARVLVFRDEMQLWNRPPLLVPTGSYHRR